jgi:lipopolysaccharide export system protein LptA
MTANKIVIICATALALVSNAFALKSDKDQPIDADARYSKTVESKSGAASDPDVTDFDGNVVLTQGSIKIRGDHATVYRMAKDAKDANAGKIIRVLVVGKQAHMQQVHDGDCSMMTTDANRIDYNPITDIAELTGGVVIVQAGRGNFHGEHMLYNTDTGDMESGDKSSPDSRVHMRMEAKTDKPAASANNCGFPASSKPAAAKPADKPAAKPADAKPADTKKTGGAR